MANITVSAPEASQAGSIVYSETVGLGWQHSSWSNVTTNLASPNAYTGQNGIEVQTFAQWGRLHLLAQSGFVFNTAGYDTLSFVLNIGKDESEDLYIGLIDLNGNVIQYRALNDVAYVEYGAFPKYEWRYVRIPLLDLGGMNRNVYGIEIQSINPATFHVDVVKFEQNGGCQ